MGVPVVATRIRGCRQVVDDGRTGASCPWATSVRSPTRSVRWPPMPGSAARSARPRRRKAAARFDQQRVIDTTLAVYESLLQRRALVA